MSDAPSRLIYVLEDNQVMCSLICMHLQNAGYRVQGYADAVEGGKALMASPPDLLVLDIAMPYLDGLELLAAMRTDDKTRHIPTIMVTARTDSDAELAAKAAGAARYLTKPLQRQQLLDAVREVLAGEVPAGH
jgi:DNA-binding response OmpR family regulator